MQRQDWLLLALSVANSRGLSAVQLQKVLFLLERGVPTEVGGNFYHFQPYNYGPFDSRVYHDADQLALSGLVNISQPNGRYNVYTVTPDGAIRAEQLKQQIATRTLDHLHNIVRWVQALTFAELVRAIYAKYPDMKQNSVFSF